MALYVRDKWEPSPNAIFGPLADSWLWVRKARISVAHPQLIRVKPRMANIKGKLLENALFGRISSSENQCGRAGRRANIHPVYLTGPDVSEHQ